MIAPKRLRLDKLRALLRKSAQQVANNKNYPTGRLMLLYFVVGLGTLIFAFAYYTRQISQLDADIDKQVDIFANLAALLPSVEDRTLQKQLIEILREESLAEDRSKPFSFIIMDADGKPLIARGVNPEFDTKVNLTEGVSLTEKEQALLAATLARMKRKHPPRKIPHFLENRTVYGYIYYGDVSPSAVAQLPFVLTDTTRAPQKWQIWGDVITAETATPEERRRAELFIQNAPASAVLQTTPTQYQGLLYYETKPYYALKWTLPIVLGIVLPVFGIVCFLIYRRIKSYEYAAVWGGLAKETAHQLGTPVSSLLAWAELLQERSRETNDAALAELATTMQGDLERLQKTTARFGMIGTQPPRTAVQLEEVFAEVLAYFEKRLPHVGQHRVEIHVLPGETPAIFANVHLLQWVFENLIRNSLDAMDKPAGRIEMQHHYDKRRAAVVVRYTDNGRGIPRQNQRKVFEPGMSTKAHGWGLGLTVVRRIIHEYHQGSIRLLETSPAGTTFEIRLPAAPGSKGSPERLL